MKEKQLKASTSERASVQALRSEFEQFATVAVDTTKEGAFYVREVTTSDTVSILTLRGEAVYEGQTHNAQVTYSNPSFNLKIAGFEDKRRSAGLQKNKPLYNYKVLLEELKRDGFILFNTSKKGTYNRQSNRLLTNEERKTQEQNAISTIARSNSKVTQCEKLEKALNDFATTLNIAQALELRTTITQLFKKLHAEAERKDAESIQAAEITKESAKLNNAIEKLKSAGISKEQILELLGITK